MREFTIERLRPEEWERGRDVRLRALADAPEAFSSALEEEQLFEDSVWVGRLEQKNVATFVAAGEEGDLGVVTSAPYGEDAGLYSMWVAPEARGKGVGGALIDALVEWARAEGYARVLLDVGDYNTAAIALYQGKGFVETGVRGTLPAPREHITEHQRALRLAR